MTLGTQIDLVTVGVEGGAVILRAVAEPNQEAGEEAETRGFHRGAPYR